VAGLPYIGRSREPYIRVGLDALFHLSPAFARPGPTVTIAFLVPFAHLPLHVINQRNKKRENQIRSSPSRSNLLAVPGEWGASRQAYAPTIPCPPRAPRSVLIHPPRRSDLTFPASITISSPAPHLANPARGIPLRINRHGRLSQPRGHRPHLLRR
jgi:hypothetical protein